MGDLACLATASYNGLQMAWGWGDVAVDGIVVAAVVVDVNIPDVVVRLEEVLHVPDGVGGAGGVGTDDGFILMIFFSTLPLLSRACKETLFDWFVRIPCKRVSL